MTKINIVILLFVGFSLLIGSANAEKLKEQKYISPDGRFVAHVVPLPKARYGSGESKIIIKTNKGKILYSKDYGSEDGKHGFGVVRAAWTPDSQFFVYSMSNSGGHQPWHTPIKFISITDFKAHSLDDYVGPIMDPNFELNKPNIIRADKRKDSLETEPFEIRLDELLKE
jgi:dipeptidyl aminopeptidase/acylaminoacyl peptidase